MKIFVAIYLLGACLNLALAQEPEIESMINPVSVEAADEPSEPKFSTLVKSTMDLLGPIDEVEEVSLSQEEDVNQTISQAE